MQDDAELQKIYDNCKKGKLLCGEDKQNACRMMEQFMQDFQKKFNAAKKKTKSLKFVK
ncbi:hypothetical protein KKH30_02885 [Candidatus Micrarchaeota archaeon]|nr:hypothetical protein [Candidatus Micrarchaeota archaeon]MBU1939681.1 hypothetical protein [Candidatus Micrarchaeota archaeon]